MNYWAEDECSEPFSVHGGHAVVGRCSGLVLPRVVLGGGPQFFCLLLSFPIVWL